MSDPSPESHDKSPAQFSTPIPEHFWQKNRLQEYTQRMGLPLPIYQTIVEGVPHALHFRSIVWVDGIWYTSPNSFTTRKAAEQDVARVAFDGIAQKIRDEVCTLICKDTIFCKSILNEYVVKMNLEKPTYTTIRPEGLLPIFVSSLVFNDVAHTGEAGRSKKEAEQLAARAVILSILGNSDSRTIMCEIVKSKVRLYAALHIVGEPHNTHSGVTPVAVNTGTSLGFPSSKGKEVEVTWDVGINNVPNITISKTCSGQLTNIPSPDQPFHEFQNSKLEQLSSQSFTPIRFVPPVLGQPLNVGTSSSRKRKRKNKKAAKNKVQFNAQFPVAVPPLSHVPSYSVAQ